MSCEATLVVARMRYLIAGNVKPARVMSDRTVAIVPSETGSKAHPRLTNYERYVHGVLPPPLQAHREYKVLTAKLPAN